MSGVTFQQSSAPLKTIKEIQFGLFSPEEIKNMSVVHVEYPEAMDEQRRGPREKGVNDPKMGSTNRAFKCGTCQEGMSECPGHFGHIELATPVYHVGFLTKTKKLLESVCHSCGKILVDESNPQFADALKVRDPKKRFDKIHALCKAKDVCETDPEPGPNDDVKDTPKAGHGGCGNRMPVIRKEGLKLFQQIKAKRKDEDEDDQRQFERRPLHPTQALNIFRNISNDDARKLGLSNDYARPEWMIITVLPVPPPPVRPSIVSDGGGGGGLTSEDDLTYKLSDIIRANANVRRCEQEGSPGHVISEFETLLQFHVATYMDNNIAGQPQALQKSGRPIKAIRSRLKGKEGRLRGNLMGKRVDFSARTVITGDPNISLHEVGVPESIARVLTYPETVTQWNIEQLARLVKTGPNNHPGAKYVIRDDGQRIDLRHHKRLDDITLQYGWKVERHLQTGDYIIFNRQPSLHKESMMGHQVKILPYSTFRLNLSVTSPYNADFDGDEMNLHVPQSEETRSEIQNLCLVPNNVVSPQHNKPNMGIVQDSLCGIYKICDKNVFLDKEQVYQAMMAVPNWDGILPYPAILKPRPRWTGKQIISMILPPINLKRGGDWAPLKERGKGEVLIREGELMYGMLEKKCVGAQAGGVVHITYNMLGPDRTVEFFNGAQRVTNHWLFHNGFSVGIGDTIPDAAALKKINASVADVNVAVTDLLEEVAAGEMELRPGMSLRESFETRALAPLNNARECIKTADLNPFNNVKTMADAGSKGSTLNIAQMSALVGQQVVEGKRIPFGFKHRSLPHFCKDDYSPQSRGFVQNSYLRGLTPTEFYFHGMSGREGLIDTAVKTAETGYIQRRLVKALEDVTIKYDTTVRNSLGDIVQFVYGEDGMDPMKIEKQKITIITSSDKKFDEQFKVNIMDPHTPLRPRLLMANDVIGDPDIQGLLDAEYDSLVSARRMLRVMRLDEDQSFHLPLNVERIIEEARRKFNIRTDTQSDLNPQYVITQVYSLLASLVVVRGDDELSKQAQDNCTLLFKALVQSHLAYKRIVMEYSLNKLAFDKVVGEIENLFKRAQASPGEMVGVIAAQSIGEPATQMTLNTFHHTGVAAKNVTLGVPRLKEILNVAADIKTPEMKIFQEQEKTREGAMQIRSRIEHTTLRHVTLRSELYYDPVIQDTVIEADRDLVEAEFILPDDEGQTSVDRQSRWLLRYTLDRKALLDKQLSAYDVMSHIKRDYPNDLAVMASDENADEQVIRIRLVDTDMDKESSEEDETEQTLKKLGEHMLDTLTLRGVKGISKAFVDKETVDVLKPNGAIVKKAEDPECKQFHLLTDGTALKAVLAIEGVDAVKTTTNHFGEVLEVLGIEGCRAALLQELRKVLSFDGAYVNYRHMGLLGDVMTARGHLMAVTRHGINRAETGALMRCSFEETVEILLEAAACGELDDCQGVSENILLGQLAPLGTGNMDIMLDQQLLNDSAVHNNAAIMGFATAGMPGGAADSGAATPYDIGSPLQDSGYATPDYNASFSPMATHGADDNAGGFSAYGGADYGAGGMSPYGGATSPYGAGATSPFSGAGAASPAWSPHSPAYSPTSPAYAAGASSPAFALTSPGFGAGSPSSPAFGSTSPQWSPTSPGGQNISPTSPMGYSPTSPSYSPTSPNYSPTSPRGGGNDYSPTSPQYSPTSPQFSPTSPRAARPAQRAGQANSPTSPAYSPTSPAGAYSPTSPGYSPTSPAAGGSGTPAWTPTSPQYSPTSPQQ